MGTPARNRPPQKSPFAKKRESGTLKYRITWGGKKNSDDSRVDAEDWPEWLKFCTSLKHPFASLIILGERFSWNNLSDLMLNRTCHYLIK